MAGQWTIKDLEEEIRKTTNRMNWLLVTAAEATDTDRRNELMEMADLLQDDIDALEAELRKLKGQ